MSTETMTHPDTYARVGGAVRALNQALRDAFSYPSMDDLRRFSDELARFNRKWDPDYQHLSAARARDRARRRSASGA